MQAAAQERLRELARAIGREEHDRPLARPERAELGDAHLELGEDLEQEGLELGIGLVDLVDQEDDPARRRDRLQQWPRQQELLGEDVARRLAPTRPARRSIRLDAQKLLLIVPLVEGAGLV